MSGLKLKCFYTGNKKGVIKAILIFSNYKGLNINLFFRLKIKIFNLKKLKVKFRRFYRVMGNNLNRLFEKIISVGFFTKFSVENIGSLSLVKKAVYTIFLLLQSSKSVKKPLTQVAETKTKSFLQSKIASSFSLLSLISGKAAGFLQSKTGVSILILTASSVLFLFYKNKNFSTSNNKNFSTSNNKNINEIELTSFDSIFKEDEVFLIVDLPEYKLTKGQIGIVTKIINYYKYSVSFNRKKSLDSSIFLKSDFSSLSSEILKLRVLK